MQITRLFEIVYILLNRKQVTAKELSNRFEVSTRTIYRDIDTLCEAGIPIYTNKGKGGGISLIEEFVLNKSVLSAKEQKEILSALQGLHALSLTEGEALSKLSALFGEEQIEWIEVDFASWQPMMKEKFETIKKAIVEMKVLEFEYYNAKMEKMVRQVEPMQLTFKERAWYLKAYCLAKQGIRLFKLTRIKELKLIDEQFLRRKKVLENYEIGRILARNLDYGVPMKVQIDAKLAYRVYDEFESQDFIIDEAGNFIVTLCYPEDAWLYGYLLSYGAYLKVLEPMRLRKTLEVQLRNMLEQYTM